MRITPRFWDFVDKTGDCWLWTGKLAGRGYGQASVKIDGHWTMAYAHRLSYEMHHGPIPAGAIVMHSCDVPNCVNPAHLCIGTHSENMRQMKGRGRSGRRFTADDVRAIREDPRPGAEIAREYGSTKEAVYAIRWRKNWAWVD